MTRTPSLVLRAAAVCAGTVVLALGGAGASHAGILPGPLSTPGTLTGTVADTLGGTSLPLPSIPLSVAPPPISPPPLSSVLALPAPSDGSSAGTGSTAGSQPGTGSPAPQPASAPAAGARTAAGSKPAGSAKPAESAKPAGSAKPAEVRARTEVATACLIPTGTASPAFEVELAVLDHDLSSPLVQQFPQVFTSCPADTVAPDQDTVVAADAIVGDLIGACVRLSRTGLPGRTTIVVLDRNLIAELTAVGLPLDRLLVPCPAAAATGGGNTGGASTTGAAPAANDPSVDGASLPDRLAFTGADVLPSLVAAACLLWLGSLLLRAAARFRPAPRRS